MKKRFASQQGESGGVFVNVMVLLCLVLLCGVLYLVRYPLMRFAGESWVIDEPMDHADAMAVLSDDNFYADRATRAAELYREGHAPLVVASGRRLRPHAGIAELMEHDLIEGGVPKNKILRLVHDADNTKDEAIALARLAAEKKWRSLLVVTSNYHTRRARYIFECVFPQGVEVRIASARDGDFDPARWWEKRISIKEFTHEVGGMLVAIWELRGRKRASQSLVGSGVPIPQLNV